MLTAARKAAIDRNAEALGVSRRLLMESAGNAIAQTVRSHASAGTGVTVLAGRGNNGGDGFAAARFLSAYDVSVTLCGHPDRIESEIARANWAVLEEAAIPTTSVTVPTDLDAPTTPIVVDALLGTGIDGPVREPVRSAIQAINAAAGTVISVDVPSGVDPDTGDVDDVAVEPDAVVTFHDRTPAHDQLDAPVTVADIGIPEAASRFVGPGDVHAFRRREASAHKGDHGRVLVIGGGPYVGAPALSGLAAYRAGCDLVEVAVPETIADSVASYHPEFIVSRLPGDRLESAHVQSLDDAATEADVVVIGPGLGAHRETTTAVETFLNGFDGRVVVDADALEALPAVDVPGSVIATPHAGEFEAMGFSAPADWRAGETAVAEAARSLDATIVLKGQYDVIADGSATRVNRTGNPGMTVGGTGDVLTGAIAALRCRGGALDAAAVGTWANGRAGDRCAESGYGFLASEVADELPAAVHETTT